MKVSALAALSLVALLAAGCGAAPTSLAQRMPTAARAAGAQQQVQLRVPATVMGYVDDYVDEVEARFAKERIKDMYGRDAGARYEVRFNPMDHNDLKIVASQNGFATTLHELNMFGPHRRLDGREMVAPFAAQAGDVVYYLEVRPRVLEISKDDDGKRLAVHHISDHGKNFRATLRR